MELRATTEDSHSITGDIIRIRRKELRISAREIAQKLQLSESVIYQIEKKQGAYEKPDPKLLKQIWDLLQPNQQDILSFGFGAVLWNAPLIGVLFGEKIINCRLTSFGRLTTAEKQDWEIDPESQFSEPIYNYLTHIRKKKLSNSLKNEEALTTTKDVREVILSPRMLESNQDMTYNDNAVFVENLPFLKGEEGQAVNFVPFSGRRLSNAFINGELDGIFISNNILPEIRQKMNKNMNYIEIATLVYGVSGASVLSIISKQNVFNLDKKVEFSSDRMEEVLKKKEDILILYYVSTISEKHKELLLDPIIEKLFPDQAKRNERVKTYNVDITNPKIVLDLVEEFFSDSKSSIDDKIVLIMGWYPINSWIEEKIRLKFKNKINIQDIDILRGLNEKRREEKYFEFNLIVREQCFDYPKNEKVIIELLHEIHSSIKILQKLSKEDKYETLISNVALYFDIPKRKVLNSLKDINFFFRINPDYFFKKADV